uniref:Protein RALF-like 32 n=1 Tax=Nelumbo nucifera TaxID=4432 RepID=A0A822XRB3_NELNU|nr:TPA_asm: hypothetical protein HUJ06_025597 [Nelumbo nucifera]
MISNGWKRTSLGFLFAMVLLLRVRSSGSSLVAAAGSSDKQWPFNDSIAECSREEEGLMESEISRRFLEQTNRISYGALKSDQATCGNGARGKPYSNSCLPTPSNTVNRGCFKVYRCRSKL